MKVAARVVSVEFIERLLEDSDEPYKPTLLTLIGVQSLDDDGEDSDDPGQISFSVRGRLEPHQVKVGDHITMEMADAEEEEPKLYN